MGNIPTFATPVGAVGAVQGVPLAETQAFVAPAVAAARVGAETANLGLQFAEKYLTAKLEVDAADQTSDLTKRLSQVQFDASKIPDRAKATEVFDAGSQKVYDAYEQSGANPFVKAHVTARFRQMQALGRADTQRASWALESETARGKMVEQLDQYGRDAATATDPRKREALISTGVDLIQGRVQAGMLNPETAAKEIAGFKSQVYANIIQVAMAQSPEAGVSAFKQYQDQLTARDAGHLRIVATAAEKGIAIDGAAMGALPALPGSVGSVVRQLTTQFPDIAKRITSGDRDHDHNTAVGGARDSMHLQPDRATDISLAGMPEAQKQQVIGAILANPNVKGFGYYPASDSIHFDTRSGARTAWGADRGAGSVGKDWPAWMTESVKSWQAGKAPSGDSFSEWQVEALRKRAAVAADPSISAEQRSAITARMEHVISTQTAYVAAQRKQIVDGFDTALTNLAIRQKDYLPGTLAKLADQMDSTGDHSMGAMYRDLAANEADLKNFWQLPPAKQLQYAHQVPGEAGKYLRAMLTEGGKLRTDALREANEQAQLARRTLEQNDNPKAAEAAVAEAIRRYRDAGRDDLAKRLAEDFGGAATGYAAGKGTPAQLEAARNTIRDVVNTGGDDLRIALAAQQQFQRTATKQAELWKNDAISAYANMTNRTLTPLDERTQNDPAMLQEWVRERSNMAKQAQTAQFDGAPAVPNTQVVGPMTQTEASIWKQSLQASNVQQQQGMAAKWATAMPDHMVGAFVKQVSGGEFGNAVGSAMWFYKRGQPGDRETADRIIEGADMRRKGGTEIKNMVSPSASEVRSTFDQALGDTRRAFANEPGLIDMLDDAAVSLYTSMVFGKADMSTYKDTEMKKAITKVYGERYNSSHGDVLLPSGIDASAFRNAIFNINDSDVPAITDRLGRPLTAAMVKSEGKMVTVGDGIYKVQLPGPGNGAMYDVPGPNGQPWTINIRTLSARGPHPGFSATQARPRVIGNPDETP